MHIPILEQTNIINEYIGGKTVLALSHQYQTNTHIINIILKDNNIAKISQAKRLNPLLIENYFEQIDKKEKTYWIGWLLTDGSVSKDNDIEIALSSKDKYILEIFESDIGVKNHVAPYCENYYRFVFGSKKNVR